MANLAGLAIGSGKQPETITWLVLDGGVILPGFVSAEYQMQNAKDGLCAEEIHLQLRGSDEELNAFVGQVAHALRGAMREGIPERAYLRLVSSALKAEVFARILKARFELKPHHLSSKSMGSFTLLINIVRESPFVGAERRLEIYNSGGVGDAQGLRLYNHDDAQIGHDNWFSVSSAGLNLEQNCPMRLELSVPEDGVSIGDVHLGSLMMHEPMAVPAMNLEAENGSGGTTMLDSRASNGRFQRYSWSGTGWANLGSWNLSSMMVSGLAAHRVKPILRLHNPVSQNGVKLRFLLRQQEKTVFESPVCYLEPAKSAQLFSSFGLGASGLPMLSYSAGLTLLLQCMQTAGSMSLDVDDILLLPQKGYRAFQSLNGLVAKSSLIDDAWRKLSWSRYNGEELKTHLSLGGWLVLMPGVEQRFYVFMSDLNQMSPIDLSLRVKAWYRPVVVIP